MPRMSPSVLLAALCMFAAVGTAPAQTQQDLLNRYVSELRKNPNDSALREKIIKHVQTMEQAPAIPTEVFKHEGAAEYVFRSAKSESDYLDSAEEYQRALIIAPWLAADYFNSGVAYERAGQYNDAITQFNFYLMAAPEAQDATTVRKRIGGLEYAARKAARESSPEAIAGRKQREYEEWLKKMDGRRYMCTAFRGVLGIIDVRGKTLVVGSLGPLPQGPNVYSESMRLPIQGRESVSRNPDATGVFPSETTFTISEDGDRITESRRFKDGDVREFVYYWQR